jgi:hypothetical protein
MCVRPRPEMRSPGGRQTTRAKSQEDKLSNAESDTAIIERQAGKLRRLYFFCHATACTVATLAWGIGR